jgi:micrococcal nuclease
MSRRVAAGAVLSALIVGACAPVDDTSRLPNGLPPLYAPSNGALAEVIRVPDGDSLVVLLNGVEERVRLIGINAPEQDECLGPESGEALRDLLDGTTVVLEADEESTDQYGRLLRYVWIGDVLANRRQAATGLAIARGFLPNTHLQHLLDEAEDLASNQKLGIWNPTACGGEAAPAVDIALVEANPAGRDEDNLNDEYIVLVNPNDIAIDLTGWILRDSSTSHRYEFPNGTTLEANAELTVRTGCGEDSAQELFWCAGGPVWDNGGDEAFLLSPSGAIAATLEYKEQR